MVIKAKRILILGGGGFIGANLCKRLINDGYTVYVYSRNFYFDEPYNGANIVYGTLNDTQKIAALLQVVDVVFNLVGTSSPATSETNRAEDIKTNLIGLVNLLDQCCQSEISRVIFLSSGGTVYGDSSSLRARSESDLLCPISTYGINKMASEHYVRLYNHLYGMNNLSLRVSNPFGRYQHPMKAQGVINIFMKNLLKGEEILVVGDGKQVRDYIYIDDVISAMVNAINYNGCIDTLNIGSGVGTELLEVIALIENEVKKKAKVLFIPGKKNDVRSVVLDISLAKKELVWSPETNLTNALTLVHNNIV